MCDILIPEMRYILLILWLVFIALQATIPGMAVAGPETTENVLRTEWPELDFNLAYEHFTKGNLSSASLEIRKGANFLYAIAKSSEGKIKEDLLRSYDELIRLSVDTEKGTVQSPLDLRRAFSRAHQALAAYYHERLKESWLKKDTDKASRELRSALANLERSIMWYGAEVEEKVAVIIKELRALGERLVQKSGSIEEEINKAIKEIEEEFNNLLGRNTEGDNKG